MVGVPVGRRVVLTDADARGRATNCRTASQVFPAIPPAASRAKRSSRRYDLRMKRLPLVALAAIVAAAAQAQTEQDVQRLDRHVQTHDLAPQGNCVVTFTLNGAGYIATLDLSKCAAKNQANALTRLGAALPFPVSSTVSRNVSLRL